MLQRHASRALAAALVITTTGTLGAACSGRSTPNPDGQPRLDRSATRDGAGGDLIAGGDLGLRCKAIEDEYPAQFEAARVCNPVHSNEQCTQLVHKAVPCPICSSLMNPANAAAINRLAELAKEWQAKGCAAGRVCPLIDCRDPTSATCEPTPPGSMVPGLCTNKM